MPLTTAESLRATPASGLISDLEGSAIEQSTLSDPLLVLGDRSDNSITADDDSGSGLASAMRPTRSGNETDDQPSEVVGSSTVIYPSVSAAYDVAVSTPTAATTSITSSAVGDSVAPQLMDTSSANALSPNPVGDSANADAITQTRLTTDTGIPSAPASKLDTADLTVQTSDEPSQNATFATIPTLATYLVSGYWAYANYDGTQPRHWGSNTISVNISALTAAEQTLATNALELWHEVANINFTFTTGAANITYNHNGDANQYVANTSDTISVSGQLYQAETIDISTYWFNNDGGAQDGRTGIYSYDFQTYLHETGHALGLGHEGPYNGSATYGVDNIYTNDTWQWSVMSYMSQDNFGGATYDYTISPEMADIYAIQSIYGAATTRTGNTTYGFNCNAGSIFSFSSYTGLGTPAFTIYDSGGTDTLDCSGYSQNQIVDVTPGHWSSVGGYVNNIGVSLSTNIENIVGGTGNDTIIPNGSLVGTLTGDGGNDTFQGTLGGLYLYTISDMNVGDKINFTDATLASFTYQRSGTTLNYGGGYYLTLSNNPIGTFTVTADPISGVDLTLVSPPPPGSISINDVSITEGNSGTKVLTFTVTRTGGTAAFSVDYATASGTATAGQDFVATSGTLQFAANDTTKTISVTIDGDTIVEPDESFYLNLFNATNSATIADSQGIGTINNDDAQKTDFNGDGKADIVLQQKDTGQVWIWEMNGTQVIGGGNVGTPGAGWKVVTTGDFDGDGKSDIVLQQKDTGQVWLWEMNGNQAVGGGNVGTPGAGWKVVKSGDFNGDGKADLVMQQKDTGQIWLWEMNGNQVIGGGNVGTPDPGWKVKTTGDLNGDGHADIVLQNDTTRQVYLWEMSGNSVIAGIGDYVIDPGWHPLATGSFASSGKADILYQNDSTGQVGITENTTTTFDNIATPNAGWQVKDTGDYNGDGTTDIVLQQQDTGQVWLWGMNGTAVTGGGNVGTPTAGWEVMAVA
jgi:hypothetical protein